MVAAAAAAGGASAGDDPEELWLEEVAGSGAEDAWEAFGRLRLVRIGTERALRHAQLQTAAGVQVAAVLPL